MTDKKTEALKLALEALEDHGHPWPQIHHESRYAQTITAIREALAEQPVQEDPCPGCRKGGVCRTPKCGRLKLPADHPFRSKQPVQQEVDWEKLYRLEVKKKEALAAKYERDTGKKLTHIVPMAKQPAQQQEPVAYKFGDAVVHIKPPVYTTPPAAPVQEPVANGLANQIETSGSPVMVQFPRHTSVLADDWTIDPAFLLRVKHTIAPDHPAEFTPSMEEIETTLLALECIPTHIYTTPPAAPVQELEKAAAMALDAIAASGDFLFNWHDCEPNNEREMDGYSEVLALNEKAFNALRKCLLTPAAQRQWVGLTREEILNLGAGIVDFEYAAAIEAKLREKNA